MSVLILIEMLLSLCLILSVLKYLSDFEPVVAKVYTLFTQVEVQILLLY